MFTVTFANLFVEKVQGQRALVLFSVAYKRIKGLREGKSATDWSDTDYNNESISVYTARH